MRCAICLCTTRSCSSSSARRASSPARRSCSRGESLRTDASCVPTPARDALISSTEGTGTWSWLSQTGHTSDGKSPPDEISAIETSRASCSRDSFSNSVASLFARSTSAISSRISNNSPRARLRLSSSCSRSAEGSSRISNAIGRGSAAVLSKARVVAASVAGTSAPRRPLRRASPRSVCAVLVASSVTERTSSYSRSCFLKRLRTS